MRAAVPRRAELGPHSTSKAASLLGATQIRSFALLGMTCHSERREEFAFGFGFAALRSSSFPDCGCAFFLTSGLVAFYKGNSGLGRPRYWPEAVGKVFNLVRRGYHTNKSHCPETRRRANGWSRHGRHKALPKVAVAGCKILRCVEPKLSPGGLRDRVREPRSLLLPLRSFAPGGVLVLG